MTALFWEEHRAALLRHAYHLVRNGADAQDLVQDTLLRAYVRRDQHRDPGAILPWLRAILYSVFCNRCVRERRRCSVGGISLDLLSDKTAELCSGCRSDDPEWVLLNSNLATELHGAIKELPPSYRECLRLSDVEGLRYAEIADRLGLTLAVVKSRLHRARRRVREVLTVRGIEG